jgi:hypothetical protein
VAQSAEIVARSANAYRNLSSSCLGLQFAEES